jgi:ABC-type oligopeptide transport system substrate-binding subunit
VQPGERLILRRNPDYWAQDLPVQRGLFNFDEIEIDYYRDADSSFEAFKAGLCDFRQETDAGRWISSYDFPAVRDGRAVILEGRSEPPITDGSGRDRTMARRALALLGEAGYAIKSGVLVERTSGRPFAFEILVQSSTQERLSRIYADGLRRIGIYATVRLVDELQYERRRQKFDFDMLIAAWIATPSPGYGQRFLRGSQSADQEASYNQPGRNKLEDRTPASAALLADDRERRPAHVGQDQQAAAVVFTGGEFVLTERPTEAKPGRIVPLRQGDAVVYAVHNRPIQGSRGSYSVNLRHGVSRVRSGQRHTLGVIFREAK